MDSPFTQKIKKMEAFDLDLDLHMGVGMGRYAQLTKVEEIKPGIYRVLEKDPKKEIRESYITSGAELLLLRISPPE